MPVVTQLGTPSGVTSLRVIGNSITWNSPVPSAGWFGDWGMAASSIDRDFAHQAANSLQLPLTRLNLADFERGPDPQSAAIATASEGVDASTAVVIELGDNVGATSDKFNNFRPSYHALLSSVAKRKTLVCVSTFWVKPQLDQILRDECIAHGGKFVYIGDLNTDPTNSDAVTNTFTDPGVASHPHDWSMANIAIRVSAALFHA